MIAGSNQAPLDPEFVECFDETKPTWKIGAEYRLGIGKAMDLNRDTPTFSTGVGRGLNEVRVFTSIARDIGWAEPYVYIWWQAPVGTTNDSLFIEPGFGQVRAFPQQQAGTQFGFEAFAVNNKETHQKVAFEFAARIDAHFEGRDYTDMWEVFQYAGDAAYGGPLMLDSDPTAPGPNPLSHPGVTNVENYLTFTARAGFHATLSENVRFGATFEMQNEQGHMISFADAGKDKATCSGNITTNCETNNNDLVNQGTEEVNPLHSSTIDTVGRRYKVQDAMNFLVGVQAQFMF